MTRSAGAASGGPVLQLLASGLQLWIRQQCQEVESLELQLHGSTIQLLRGRLEGVTLTAQRVVYRELRLERVQLTSAPIQVRMGGLLKGQGLQLENPFAINGSVALSGEGLELALTRPPWAWLGHRLARELLGRESLGGLSIDGQELLLRAPAGQGEAVPFERKTLPLATAGSIEIRAVEGVATFLLPMDPSIRIERVHLEGDQLELHGEARVSP